MLKMCSRILLQWITNESNMNGFYIITYLQKISFDNIVSINDNLKSMPQTHGHHEVNSCQAYCFYIY